MQRPLVAIAIAILTSGCRKPVPLPTPAVLNPDRTGVSEPARVPPLDDRAYRILRLDNGLTAMLVSDPDTPTTAAALTVEAGHFDNPDDRPGLAHFLEHMLFLGTETYPSPTGHDLHLARHGGESNAWTSRHLTQFHFSVDPSGFDEALHRFSRFFVDPALDGRYVKKERRAVESEYRLNIEGRSRRWDAAVGQTVHPDHPASRFTIGSKETLADRGQDKVLDDLRAFYDTWYTADRMHLAVVGSHSLDTLEGQVRSWFAELPQAAQPLAPRTYGPHYRDDQLGVRIDIDQLEDVHGLRLQWPIPEQSDAWPNDPAELLGHVLGDEGPGSLFAQLAERNWLSSLSAGDLDGLGPDGDTFSLNMDVTEEGIEHTDEIIAACFAAIQTLRDTPMPDHLAPEIVALNQLEFAYDSPRDPAELSEWLSETMTEHPPERVLDAWLTQPVSDSETISGLLDLLTVDRVRIIVDSQGLEGETEREPHYNVAHRVRPLSEQERTRFTAGSELTVSLPPVNPWVPTDTHMRTEQTARLPTRLAPTGDDLDKVEMWTTPAATWRSPKTITALTLRTSETGFDMAQDSVTAAVFSAMLNQHLIDFSYPIKLAGSQHRLSIRPSRFQLTASAWTEIQPNLIGQVLAEVRAFEPEEANFDATKAELLSSWSNHVHARPVDRLPRIPYQSINPEDFHYSEGIAHLEALTFADLTAFADDYWQRPGSLRVHTYGNVDDAVTRQIAQVGLDQLPVTEALDHHDYQQVQWLPDGVERTLEVQVDHDDSAIFMLYQGPAGVAHHARFIMLGELIEIPFFQELRTRQQLGYIANAYDVSSRMSTGFQLSLQSSVAGPSKLLNRTEDFLRSWPRQLEKLDQADFATARQALAERYRAPTNTLEQGNWEASNALFWGDGELAYYDVLAAAVEQVTQEEVVALAESLFNTDSPTRIVAWAVGRAHADDPLKGTAECADRTCVAEGMDVRFTMDFADPDPAGMADPR